MVNSFANYKTWKPRNHYFYGEINPPDAVNGGGGKWYRYVLPSQWIKDAWQ
jgi:hypothetical protein